MDGVTHSFCDAVITQLNKETGKSVTIEDIINANSWNLESLWGLNGFQWWKAIDKNPTFWLDIKPFPWAKDLYDDLHKYADEVKIISAPSRSPLCIPQKRQALEKIGIPSGENDAFFEKNKYKYASSDVLLIDDGDHNIDPFIKHGGNALKIPSDWNCIDLNYDVVSEVIFNYLNHGE